MFGEDGGDDVEQKMQWFVEMLPGTHEQRQLMAPVLRWAIDAARKNRNCVTEDGKENASTESE